MTEDKLVALDMVEPFVLAMLQEYVPPPMEVDTFPVEPAQTVPEGPVIVQTGGTGAAPLMLRIIQLSPVPEGVIVIL